MEETWQLIGDEILDPINIVEETTTEEEEDIIVPNPVVATKDDLVKDTDDFNPFKILAEDLGIEFDGDSAEEFKEKLMEQAKMEVLQGMNLDDPQVGNLITFLSDGGDVKDYIQLLAQLPSVNKMSEEQLYTAYLKDTTNFSDAKVLKLVKQAVDLDEIEDEAAIARDHFTNLEKESVQELQKRQLELTKQREIQQAAELELKKEFLNKKSILGQPIVDTKGFEKYYFDRKDIFEDTDGKKYRVTAHEKAMIDVQNNPQKRVEYEMLMAYLNFSGFKPAKQEEIHIKNEVIQDLKAKLRASYSRGNKSTLIDEY